MMYVIEPHADDAFLSLHDHMVSWLRHTKLTIVTIYSTDRRDKEGEAYANQIGAEYQSLTIKDQSHLSSPPKPIPPFKYWGIDVKKEDQLVFPIGLQHPDHVQVRKQAQPGSWFYLDTPYQAKLKLADDLRKLVMNRLIVSIRYPKSTKWRYIDLFKSQSKFFHWNPVESLRKIPEIIVQ